jgi:hypothetical protein
VDWKIPGRKVVYFNKLDKISSNLSQNMSSDLADDTAKNPNGVTGV